MHHPEFLHGRVKRFSAVVFVLLMLFGTRCISAQRSSSSEVSFPLFQSVDSIINGNVEYERLGSSVSISKDGNRLVVSSRSSVYVYDYSLTKTKWILSKEIHFYESLLEIHVQMSSDGNSIIVGLSYRDFEKDMFTAKAVVYALSSVGNKWEQIGQDIARDFQYVAETNIAVSINGNGTRIAVGFPLSNQGSLPKAGMTHVYSMSEYSMEWNLLQEIRGKSANEYAGTAIALDYIGNTIAIGSPGYTEHGILIQVGCVRVYEYTSGIGKFLEMGADIFGNKNKDSFGTSLGISHDGNIIIIGAERYYVRVYSYDTSCDEWYQMGQEIDWINEDIDSNEEYEYRESVSMNGNGTVIAVGAKHYSNHSGKVRVYTFSTEDQLWKTLNQDIIGGDEGYDMGSSVTLSADAARLVIGSPGNSKMHAEGGSVLVYDNTSMAKSISHKLDISSIIRIVLASGLVVLIGRALVIQHLRTRTKVVESGSILSPDLDPETVRSTFANIYSVVLPNSGKIGVARNNDIVTTSMHPTANHLPSSLPSASIHLI
jgi:WD40 repeat protein